MPPLPDAGPVVRVRLKHTIGDDFDVLDRFYVGYVGSGPDVLELQTFATAVTTSWSTNLRSMCGAVVVLTEAICTDLSSDTAAEGTSAVSYSGTRSGAALPAANASLINFSIARRYRGGKPRIYLPMGTDTDVASPQTWQPGFLSELTT